MTIYDVYKVPHTYNVNSVIITRNSQFFESLYRENKWSEIRNILLPQSSIANLIELVSKHGIYECVKISIVDVIYFYESGDIFKIVNWERIHNFLIDRIKSTSAEEKKQIVQHLNTITDDTILKRLQILFQALHVISINFDSILIEAINQRAADVKNICDIVKYLKKENEDLKKQVIDLQTETMKLNETIASLKTQIALHKNVSK